MEKKENLLEMWAETINSLPESTTDVKMQYLYLKRKKIDGVCGSNYFVEYIGSTHPNRNILASVKTVAWYLGNIVNESTKDILVKPGEVNEVKLGCTGWENPTGPHTEYRRSIIRADWA
jgi:hypothetical protein